MSGTHVVELVDSLRVGGAERLVVQAATGLAARGDTVTVVVLDATARHRGHLDELARSGVEVRFLPALLRPSLADPGRVVRLAQLLLELDAEVVHADLTYANVLGGLAARRAKVPFVATLHNTAPPPGNRARLLAAIETIVVDRCAAVVVGVGPAVVAANEGRFRRVPVVPLANPVGLPSDVTPERQAALRAELLGRRGGPLVLAVGRLSPQKAFGDLIDAAVLAAPDLPELVVAIVGEGALRPELEAQIDRLGLRDQVRLLGIRSDVPEIMASADVRTMTSHWEGLPLTLLEAMAVGLPVVATRVGDVVGATRAEDGEPLVALVDPGRPDQVAAALVAATSRRPEVVAQAERARRHVARTASLDVWTDHLGALLARHATHPIGDRRPSVAVLTHGYWPRIGGIERQRALITPLLRSRGLDARVVCRRDPETAPFDLVAGVPVHRVATPGPKVLAAAGYTAAALARVVLFRPDVVHAHEFHSTAPSASWPPVSSDGPWW